MCEPEDPVENSAGRSGPGRERVSCWDKSLDLLSRRPHFRMELANKLRKRDYSSEEIEETLVRLAERSFLDDVATADAFVASRLRRSQGPRKILAELSRRGVDSEIARGALASVTIEDEIEMARQVAESYQRRSAGSGKEAVARHLDRRGFGQRAILTVLDGIDTGAEGA